VSCQNAHISSRLKMLKRIVVSLSACPPGLLSLSLYFSCTVIKYTELLVKQLKLLVLHSRTRLEMDPGSFSESINKVCSSVQSLFSNAKYINKYI
jgi:hypothetical protein